MSGGGGAYSVKGEGLSEWRGGAYSVKGAGLSEWRGRGL